MSAPILSIRSSEAIKLAVRYLQAGELVIIPTDTIYGLAAYPTPSAVDRLAKVRDRRMPELALPLLLAGVRQLSSLTRPSALVHRLARHYWPGSLTLMVEASPELTIVRPPMPVAVRVPNLPDLVPLLQASGGYLVVSGAVRSGQSPAITAQEAAAFYGEDVALILDGGRSPYGVPSTVIDCTVSPPSIVRRGSIVDDALLGLLGLKDKHSSA